MTMKKYFGSINLSIKRLIILSIIIAVYVGLINSLTFLRDTSFQDIAINLEWWILFAVFIISNCKSAKEAIIKCFLFFLISQPLIYLVEVPFSNEGFGLFRYYYYWFKITLLTIPGAFIAYQIKRGDWLSAVIVGVSNTYLIYQSICYLQSILSNFPHHLLSFVFCIGLSILLIIVFLDDKVKRIISIIYIVVVFVMICLFKPLRLKVETEVVDLPLGNWQIVEKDEGLNVKIVDNKLIVEKSDVSDGVVVIESEEKKIAYWITIYNNDIYINEITD